MRWQAARPWAATVLRVILGGVFLVAGALKMPDQAAALRGVRAYQLVPEALVPAVAYGLPAMEVVLGVALLVGLFVRYSALASGLLLVVFMAGIVSAWSRGLSIDCGCFGKGGEVAPSQTQYGPELVRDGLLLLASAFLVRWPMSRLSADRWLAGSQPSPVVAAGTESTADEVPAQTS